MARWLRSLAIVMLTMLGLAFVVAPAHGSAAVPAPVYLNHSYGIFSEATIKALQTNPYLTEQFVNVEVKTTVRPDITYTGTYLFTRETYLEFFPVGTFDLDTGVMGMALSDETTGGIETVQERWAKEFGEGGVSPIELISREVEGVVVPWFRSVNPTWVASSPDTFLWNMEYVPAEGSTQPGTRREYLASRYDPGKLAQNVQGLVYGLPDGEREEFRRSLAAVDWTVREVGSGYVASSPVDAGTSRVVYVVPATPGRQGMLGVVWKLNRTPAPHVEQLGDAVLTVGIDGRPYGSLWFVPPSPGDEAVLVS